MDEIRNAFNLMGVFYLPFALVPIILCGMLLPITKNRVPKGGLRVLLQIGIIIVSIFIGGFLFIVSFYPINAIAMANLIYFFLPVDIPTLLFFWFPIIVQFLYVNTRRTPRMLITSLVGLLALIIGAVVYIGAGIALRAPTD
jgi:hypothetical protein